MNRVVFSSASDDWATPAATFAALNAEFGFADDPCPLGGDINGLMREWGNPCFVNPPYSAIGPWMERARLEAAAGKTVVLLVPSRTDTRWWHEHAMKATEIRFIKGRLKFGDAKTDAPFPSCVVVFAPRAAPANTRIVEGETT